MKKSAYISASLLSLSSTFATASTATDSLVVKANVIKSCVVNTSSTGNVNQAVIDFGTITSLTDNLVSSTTSTNGNKVSVLCSNTTPWSIALDGGQNANSEQRRMAGGNNEFIPYDLFADNSLTKAIEINTPALNGIGNGQQQSYDIFGRIPAGTQLPSPGAYIDTVTVTVTY